MTTPGKLFYTDAMIASILTRTRGMVKSDALAKAAAMSKQRRRQVYLQSNGLCIVCGKKHDRHKGRCDSCAEKHGKLALARYHRIRRERKATP